MLTTTATDLNGIVVSASRGRGGGQVLVAAAADRGVVVVGRWGLGILEALLVVDLPQPLDLLLQRLLVSCIEPERLL
jgi:hypothetical protein